MIADNGAANPQRFTDRTGIDASPVWLSGSKLAWAALANNNFDLFDSDVPAVAAPVNLTVISATDTGPSLDCGANTLVFLSTRSSATTEAFQLDLNTGLVVKYVLPTVWAMQAVRRTC